MTALIARKAATTAGARDLRRVLGIGLSVAGAVLMAGIAVASAEGQPTREAIQEKLEAQKKALEGAESAARKGQSTARPSAAEREALTRQLAETAKNVQRREARLTEIEGRITELDGQEASARQDLAARHDQIARLLGTLQRMGRNPPPVMITERADALAMLRAAMVLAHAQPHLSAEASDLAKRVESLVKVLEQQRAERERERAELARMRDEQTKLAALLDDKRKAEAEDRPIFEEARRQAQKIAEAAPDSSSLVEQLGRAATPRQPATGVRTLEIQVPQAAGAPQAGAATPKQSSQPPVVSRLPSPVEPGVEAPSATGPRIVLAPTASSTPTVPRRLQLQPFERLKGRLALPAAGRRVIAFGEKNKYGRNSEGLAIETRFGARITAPADGWVAYASPFRTIGHLLIMDVGDGYYIVMVGMSQIDVQPGHFVSASEPVGTMPLASAAGAKEPLPSLYIEFRKDNRTIDPDPWWAATEQKVQG